MTLVAAWLAVPVLLTVLCAGWGTLAVRVAGIRVPGPLLVPVGLAAMIVVAGLLTVADATAELATPVVLGLAVTGGLLAYGRDRSARGPWRAAGPPAVAALVAFVAYAAPVVMSGEATFAGYVKLDDTASWLAQTDHVMERGRAIDDLPPSSYDATLQSYVGLGYPVGGILPLGVIAAISGIDAAWLFQPYEAFLGAALALALFAVLEGFVARPWLRALAAAVAAQATLLFGYALWGGVKELVAAGMLATLVALVPLTLSALSREARVPWRALACLALPGACLLAALSFGSLPWIGAALVATLPGAVSRLGLATTVRASAKLGALMVLLGASAFVGAIEFVRFADAILTPESELGNLNGPLNPLQVLGIWLSGDFRVPPTDPAPTYVLLAVVGLAAAAGLIAAVRRGALGLAIYVVATAVGATGLFAIGSPWVDGKALATASPAFVLAAMACASALIERARRVEGAILAVVVAGGVLTSNALAYQEVWLAPRDALTELEAIGERTAGQGPTLLTSFDPFAARHFLRRADAEEASGLRRRIVPLRDGSMLPEGEAADIDRFRFPDLLVYRTLVVRQSPLASRPPSVYRRIWRGRHWEAWQRPEPLDATIREHAALGRGERPAAVASCSLVRRLAGEAGAAGSLAAAVRPRAIILPMGEQGNIDTTVIVPVAGRWEAWLGGSFKPRARLTMNGRPVGALRHRIGHAAATWPLGATTLPAGPVRVSLRFDPPDWRPGSAGASLPAGPLVLGQAPSDAIVVVPSRDWGRLCGRRLDWIEAIR
jgi:hypothetical protein